MHNLVVKNHKGNLMGVLDKTHYERVARVNGDLYTVFNIYDTENNKDVIRNIDKRWTIEIIQDESKDEFVVQNIYEKFEDNNLVLEVDTLHRTYDELKREVMNVSYTGSKTAEEWFKYLFEGSKFKHDTDMSFKYAKSLDNFGYDNRLNLLFRLCDTFNVEFYIVGNTVHIVNTIGYNKQDYIEYGVNLTSISRNRVMEGFGTRITLIGKPITDEDDKITGYHTYTYTHELSKEYGIIDLPPVVDERYTDKESMKQRCIDEITSSFTTSLEVEVSDLKFKLGKTDLLEGDYIRIFDPRLNFNSSIRVVETRFTIDEFGEYINRTFVLGDYNESYSSSIKDKNQIKDLENSLAESNKVINYVQNSADGKNKIFYGRFGEDGLGEPVAENVGDLWFKPNREYTIGYMWNGKEWEEFLNTETEDLIKDELVQMDKDVQEAKDKADEVATGLDVIKVDVDKAIEDSQKAKEDAIKAIEENEITKVEAQKAKEQSDQAIKDASTSMLNAKEALDKATENETSIGGLQVDIDKTNNELKTKANQSDLNALKGTVTNQQTQITQNATDIKTKAEKTYVDTINNKVDKQQTQINQNSESIKLKAEKQEVTNLKNELDELEKINRNFFINSDNLTQDRLKLLGDSRVGWFKKNEIDGYGFEFSSWYILETKPNEIFGYISAENGKYTDEYYTNSIYIRNDGIVPLYVVDNTGQRVEVKPKEINRVVLTKKFGLSLNKQINFANAGTSAYLTIARPKIERGSKVTEWSNAPEDFATADKVEELSASIEVQAGKIEMKADQVVVDNLKNTVNKQGTAITQNSEAIKLKAEKSQVDGLTGKVDKQQTEINQNAEQIKLKANQSTVNDIDKKVTNQQAQINLNSENIKLKAEKSEVTNLKEEVDSIEKNNRNYFLRSDDIKQDDLKLLGNSKVGWFKKTIVDGYDFEFSSWYIENTIPNQIFGFVSAKSGNYTDEVYTNSIYVKNDGKADIYISDNIGRKETVSPGQVKRVVLTGGFTNKVAKQFVFLNAGLSAYLTIARPKIEKGNRATDWSLAPEDLATQSDVTKLEASINVEAGKITNLTSSVNKNSTDIGKLTIESNKISSQVTSIEKDVIKHTSQITQLSDDILLRVQKNDVVNQINISTEGILIDGKKVHITGQTKIDNAVIKDAMIDSMTANKLTAGAIDANKIRVLNIDANNITSGYISSNRIKSKSITSDKIDVMSLSAISADLGRVTAGQLNAVDIYGSRISGGWLMPDSTYVTVDEYTNGNRYTWNSFTKYGYFSVTETRNTNTNKLEEIFIYSMTRDGILAEKYSATSGITEGQGLGCPTNAGMINLSFGKRTYYKGEPKYYLHSKNPSLKPRDVLIP